MMPPLRPCMKCPKAFAPLCRSALHFSLEMSLLEAVQLISGPGLLPTSMMCISHRFRVTEKLHCTGSFQGFYQVPQEPVKVCRDWLTIIETAPCDSKLSHGCMQCCFCFHVIECMHAFGCWKRPVYSPVYTTPPPPPPLPHLTTEQV